MIKYVQLASWLSSVTDVIRIIVYGMLPYRSPNDCIRLLRLLLEKEINIALLA